METELVSFRVLENDIIQPVIQYRQLAGKLKETAGSADNIQHEE